jgi:hypothetical protein
MPDITNYKDDLPDEPMGWECEKYNCSTFYSIYEWLLMAENTGRLDICQNCLENNNQL